MDDDRKEKLREARKLAWKKAPLKVKLIIIGIGLGFFMIIIFITIIIGTLMYLNLIDESGIINDFAFNYSSISANAPFWWPVGSTESYTDGGVTFDSGEPIETIITSEFGNRDDPFGNETKYHGGIDIAPDGGYMYNTVNIVAVKDGEVIYPSDGDVINCPSSNSESDCGDGYGNYVMIKHNDGSITLYGHMYENSITVRKGQNVVRGQVLGKMGTSGRSTGPHLHFEVRVNGERVDPINYVSKDNPRPSDDYGITTGNDNVQTICLSLKNNNLSNVATAGILGNMERESNYDPGATNSLGCIGLVQWCYGRANNLKDTYGSSWENISNQLEFMFGELNGSESAVLSYLNDTSITSPRLMAEKFCSVYERPEEGECENGKRQNFAENKYNYVINGCQ